MCPNTYIDFVAVWLARTASRVRLNTFQKHRFHYSGPMSKTHITWHAARTVFEGFLVSPMSKTYITCHTARTVFEEVLVSLWGVFLKAARVPQSTLWLINFSRGSWTSWVSLGPFWDSVRCLWTPMGPLGRLGVHFEALGFWHWEGIENGWDWIEQGLKRAWEGIEEDENYGYPQTGPNRSLLAL